MKTLFAITFLLIFSITVLAQSPCLSEHNRTFGFPGNPNCSLETGEELQARMNAIDRRDAKVKKKAKTSRVRLRRLKVKRVVWGGGKSLHAVNLILSACGLSSRETSLPTSAPMMDRLTEGCPTAIS